MAFLPVVAAVASIGGGIIGAMGQMQAAKAQENAARYNADLAQRNADIQKQNAAITAQAGAAQVAAKGMENRAKIGGLIANQAAAGLDVMSGSPLDVRSSAAELGQLDALTIRSNATKAAYGEEIGAANSQAQSTLDTMQAKSAASAGSIAAAGTLLGTVGSAASNWGQWQLKGGGGTINTGGGWNDYSGDFSEFAMG